MGDNVGVGSLCYLLPVGTDLRTNMRTDLRTTFDCVT